MGVPVLAVNLSQHARSSAAGAVDPGADAALLGAVGGVDLFAALLAQQVGQLQMGTGKHAAVGQSADAAQSEDKADPASGTSPSVDGLSAVMSGAAPVDPSLLAQQAALVPHVAPIPSEVKGATPAVAQHDVAADAVVSGISRSAQGAAVDPNGATTRQPVAADSATFAIPQDAKSASGGADPAKPAAQLATAAPVQEKTPELDANPLPVAEKVQEMHWAQADMTVSSAQVQQVVAAPVGITHPNPASNVAAPQGASQPVSGISYQVGHSAWGEALGHQVVWMVGQNHQGVELHLNPPSLGPLEVRLSMSDGQANLSFATQHLAVKDAIDTATPRLREMLGDSGISLGSVSVNVGSFTQQNQNGQAPQSGASRTAWVEVPAATDFASVLPSGVSRMSGNGLVDTFA